MVAALRLLFGDPPPPPPPRPFVDLRNALLCLDCEALYDHGEPSCPRCASREAIDAHRYLGGEPIQLPKRGAA